MGEQSTAFHQTMGERLGSGTHLEPLFFRREAKISACRAAQLKRPTFPLVFIDKILQETIDFFLSLGRDRNHGVKRG
jgi:hypothetical protein